MEAENQLELYDESKLPIGRELLWCEEKQLHQFTLERVAKNKDRYAAIVQAIAEGLSVRQICAAYGVSHHVVAMIREKDAAGVATEKEQLAKKLMRLARVTVERLEEAIEKNEISPGQLPIAMAIIVDKSLLLAGQAMQTITVRHELSMDAVMAKFAALRPPEMRVIGSSPEFQSGVVPSESLQIEVISECVPHFVPTPTAYDAISDPVTTPETPGWPVPPGATATATLPAKGGGGGEVLPVGSEG